jgi:hypothetical protein
MNGPLHKRVAGPCRPQEPAADADHLTITVAYFEKLRFEASERR